eukprot:scaffold22086_cov71-Cyclotella_meneghiniana.AAC.4
MNNNNNNGVDHHQSRHTQQQKPREAKQVLQTCRRSPPTSITVNKNTHSHDKNLKGRTPEMGEQTEDDFEIFRREFMTDIVVTSLRDDLGDDIATLKMDPDTGSYNIEFNVAIRESVSTPPSQEQGKEGKFQATTMVLTQQTLPNYHTGLNRPTLLPTCLHKNDQSLR